MIYSFYLRNKGQELQVVDHDVRLFYSLPGTAKFRVVSNEPISGSVYFSLSMNHMTRHGHFYGFIERCVRSTENTYILFCREMLAVLDRRLPVSLRHVSAKAVLDKVTDATEVEFSIPNSTSFDVSIPYFTHTGSALDIVRSLGNVFSINDYVCQQKRDGSVFVGSWSDGQWADNEINLPNEVFANALSTDIAEIMAIPGLRPNFVLNGKRIYALALKGVKMVVTWTKP